MVRLGRPMSAPKATISPTTRDLGWSAGFLEGEGSFSASGKYKSPQVAAEQVNREPLDKLQLFFGGTVAGPCAQKNPTKKWSPYYRWFVSGPRARGIMLTLYGLFSAKRQQQIRKAL